MLDWIRQHIINRGQLAQAMIDNAAYEQAVEQVRQDYLNLFVNSPADKQNVRETAYLAIRALADVDRQLRVYISEAKYEEQSEQQPQNGVQ